MVCSKVENTGMVCVALALALFVFSPVGTGARSRTTVFAGIEMVLVPGRDRTASFYLGKYEVTQRQYENVTGNNPSHFRDKPDHPVENVNWFEAVEFCNKLSEKAGLTPCYAIDKTGSNSDVKNEQDSLKWIVTINEGANGFRLPTSAEWEHACRAGTKTSYYWGDRREFDTVNRYAVYLYNSERKGIGHEDFGTHRTGTKKPNAWGFHDMCGNVYEWCFDRQPDCCRVLRGGSWADDAAFLESASWISDTPDSGGSLVGIRIAKNL